MSRTRICAPFCLLAALAPAMAENHLLGLGWNFGLYSIDESTAESTLIGYTGGPHYNSLARNSSGALLSHDAEGSLVWLDPEDATQTVGAFTGFENVTAMAFDANDTLYAITHTFGQTQARLRTFNVLTGASVEIGAVPGSTMGLDFAPDGTLYGWNNSYGLLRIDPETSSWEDVHAGFAGEEDVQSICFAPDGTLYAVRDTLYLVDFYDGDLHAIGDVNLDLRGLVWVPEPAASIGMLAGLALARRRVARGAPMTA